MAPFFVGHAPIGAVGGNGRIQTLKLDPQPQGQRMLLGSNGLFVQMRTPWLECTTRVGDVDMRLPFGEVREAIRFTFGGIPRALLDAFIEHARAGVPLSEGDARALCARRP